MKLLRGIAFGLLAAACPLTAPAEQVTYTLENVILDEGAEQMFGTFTFTYTPGDFENGTGDFTFLDIPFTWHDHTDLNATFDIGSSIEIVLDGSVHDDGVDITLFLLEPLTPTAGTAIDLVRSRYEIGGNGFHDGFFLSGEIRPEGETGAGDAPSAPAPLAAHPNPFNPQVTLRAELPAAGPVFLSIHDLSGRRLATLADGERMAAGGLMRRWDGRDAAGNELGSGVYLARLVAPGLHATRKLVLLR